MLGRAEDQTEPSGPPGSSVPLDTQPLAVFKECSTDMVPISQFKGKMIKRVRGHQDWYSGGRCSVGKALDAHGPQGTGLGAAIHLCTRDRPWPGNGLLAPSYEGKEVWSR